MNKQVEKKWGIERWIENSEKYCMKTLTLQPGWQSSMHFHKIKTETFLVVAGRVKLEVMRGFRTSPDSETAIHTIRLKPYQAYTLEPYTPHRFSAIDGEAVVVEASTKHDDEDVVRLEESRAIGS